MYKTAGEIFTVAEGRGVGSFSAVASGIVKGARCILRVLRYFVPGVLAKPVNETAKTAIGGQRSFLPAIEARAKANAANDGATPTPPKATRGWWY